MRRSRPAERLAKPLQAPVTVRAGKHVILGRTGVNTLTASGGEAFLAPAATLDLAPGGARAPATRPPNAVAAPLFAWQRQRLERGEARVRR
jgi:hypothetical protein